MTPSSGGPGDQRGPVEWDAAAYQVQSTPQQSWGDEVIGRLDLRGDETVLDLGCGAGIITEKLVALVPGGRVVGVDASRTMIEAARRRLGPRAEFVVSDLHEFEAAEPADLLFSTATLHWVPDHPRLWRHLRPFLGPDGHLEVQCGGAGNVAVVERAMAVLAERTPFADFLRPFRSPWTFDSAETAAQEVRAAGFRDVRTWLELREARPPDVGAFLRTSVVLGELTKLPSDLRPVYGDALFADLGRPDHLDYVRLNISATA